MTYYEVLKLDKDVGYAQKHVTLNKENGDIVRQEIHYSGIKLSVSVVGIGESFSLGNLVIYLFSTM